MRLNAREAEDLVLYQVAAVAGVAAAEGVRLRHVKPHGALYNMAARDSVLAGAIARAAAAVDRSLILYGLPNSELLKAARAAGLRTAAEGFADRAYEPDGGLMSRRKLGALLVDPEIVVARALRLVREHAVAASDGTPLTLHIDTLCVHGDTPGADELAARLRRGLEAAGINVQAMSD
jgi:5-oxoprolinase (ATP-hydrolysing) subunit A